MKPEVEIWLSTGHKAFAKNGANALKIDTLAKNVGKSRSSFYHLYGDMEGYLEALIEYALEITRQFGIETQDIENFFPEYGEVMVRYRDMLFFNKHIFLESKNNKVYAETWEKITALTDDKTEVLWMKLAELEDLPPHQKEEFYLTIRTAAFMRLQYDTYTYDNIFKVVNDVNQSFKFLLGN